MTKKRLKIYAWFVWLLTAFLFFYLNILEFLPADIGAALKIKFDISNIALGLLGGTFFYAHLVFHIPSGMLIDRYGPRMMTGLGVLVTTIGMVIFISGQNLFMVGVGRFLTGLGSAFMVVNTLKIAANWFPNQRFAFLVGLMMSLGLMGPLFINFVFTDIITSYGPWKSLYIITLFGLVIGILHLIFARDSRTNFLHHTKEDIPRHLANKILLIIKSPQNWRLAIIYALAITPLTLYAGLWGTPFIEQEFHRPEAMALEGVAFLLLGFAIGAPFFGFLSEKIKRRKVILQYGLIASFLMFLVLLYVPNYTYLPGRLQTFLFGFANSTVMLTFAMIYDINPKIITGTVMGFMFTLQAIMTSVNDPLIGYLSEKTFLDPSNNLLHALSIILIYLAIANVLLIFTKETHCKTSAIDKEML